MKTKEEEKIHRGPSFEQSTLFLAEHINLMEKTYREFSMKQKKNGKTVTPLHLKANLTLSFYKVGDGASGDKFLGDPQIAVDALEILKSLLDEDITASLASYEAMANEFKSPYKDPDEQVNSLYSYIQWCDKEFQQGHQDKWYSPYITICQSSGWGKSRIVRQLSALTPVLYLSYRGIQSNGYPGRTTEAIDFLNLEVTKNGRSGSNKT
jgi:hypothetical protein